MASYPRENPRENTPLERIEYNLAEKACTKKGLSEVETSAFLYIFTVTKNGELGHEAFDDAAGLTLEEQLLDIDNHSYLFSKEEIEMFKRLHRDKDFREQMVQRYISDIKPYVDNAPDLEFSDEMQPNKTLN